MSKLNRLIKGVHYHDWSNFYKAANMGINGNYINTDLTFYVNTTNRKSHFVHVKAEVIARLDTVL
jgi:hypothetical protein